VDETHKPAKNGMTSILSSSRKERRNDKR